MRIDWRSIGRWLFGVERAAHVRFVHEVECTSSTAGLFVCVPLGGTLARARSDLAVSDRFGPARVREVVEFAARRNLPVDGWVIRGVGTLPVRCARAGDWIAGLARAAGDGTIFVSVGALDAETAERLAAHVRRHGVAVEFSRPPEEGTAAGPDREQ